MLRVVPGARRTLRVRPSAADVRLVGAPRAARLTGRDGRWTLRLPAGTRPRARLVVDTGAAFFAARLAPR